VKRRAGIGWVAGRSRVSRGRLLSAVVFGLVVLAGCLDLFGGEASVGQALGKPRLEFFAMDTALRDGRERSAGEQAALLKELGYDGLGAGGIVSEEMFTAFEEAGLRIYNTYLTLDMDAAKPELDPALTAFLPRLKGRGTDLWIAVNAVTVGGVRLGPSDPSGDEVGVERLRRLAELAEPYGVRIALYPHTWFWLERFEDGVRVARAVDRANVGATFNLCHWLKVEGDRDPRRVLEEGLSRVFYVSVNGADRGDTRAMGWDRLIQPLDAGSYDVAGLVGMLGEIGYRGPIGFQGYGIPGDSREILSRTMRAWRGM